MSFFKRTPGRKYSNAKIQYNGHSFSSKLEAAVYQILMLRMKAKEIDTIQTQDHIYLTDAKILYIPDFKCTFQGKVFFVEAKGFETPEWRIKRRLWKHYGPGPLEIWMGSHSNPKLTEIVEPIVKTPSV